MSLSPVLLLWLLSLSPQVMVGGLTVSGAVTVSAEPAAEESADADATPLSHCDGEYDVEKYQLGDLVVCQGAAYSELTRGTPAL